MAERNAGAQARSRLHAYEELHPQHLGEKQLKRAGEKGPGTPRQKKEFQALPTVM